MNLKTTLTILRFGFVFVLTIIFFEYRKLSNNGHGKREHLWKSKNILSTSYSIRMVPTIWIIQILCIMPIDLRQSKKIDLLCYTCIKINTNNYLIFFYRQKII